MLFRSSSLTLSSDITIIGDTTGNLLDVSAGLAPLADNGGATFTMAPQPGSPLISPTNPAGGLFADQRGVGRTVPFSIGAYQVVRATAATVFPSAGRLGIGANVDVNILFSQPVSVSGTPRIALNMPGAFATAVNLGQPAANITFRYIVAAGDFSQGISVASGATLDFSGGDITDSAGAPVQVQVPAPVAPGAAVDGVAPAPFVGFSSPLPANPSNAPGFSAFASFGETGLAGALAPDDFTLVNATVGSISGPDASGKYTFVITPISDGNVRFSLKSGALADAAGNLGPLSAARSFRVDTTAPRLSLSSSKASLVGAETATLTFTFSEAPGSSFSAVRVSWSADCSTRR